MMKLTGDNKFQFQCELRAFGNLITMYESNLADIKTDPKKTLIEVKQLINKLNITLSKYEN